jgi:hypothetical protein
MKINNDQQGFHYQKHKCSHITEAKIKKGIFFGQIKRLTGDNAFHNVAHRPIAKQ